MGMVFGGLLGFGAGFSFIRGLFLSGPSVMDGYWFLGTSVIFFLLIPAMLRVSKLMSVMFVDIGTALFILGLSLADFLGTDQLPLTISGWLALIFSISCFYMATAQMTNALYGKRIMPY
jgi:succinate-acetate transporter protein